jgi:hypothetical protein
VSRYWTKAKQKVGGDLLFTVYFCFLFFVLKLRTVFYRHRQLIRYENNGPGPTFCPKTKLRKLYLLNKYAHNISSRSADRFSKLSRVESTKQDFLMQTSKMSINLLL